MIFVVFYCADFKPWLPD